MCQSRISAVDLILTKDTCSHFGTVSIYSWWCAAHECARSFFAFPVLPVLLNAPGGKWFLATRVHRGSPSLFKPALHRLAGASTLWSTWHRPPLGPDSQPNTYILCRVFSQFVAAHQNGISTVGHQDRACRTCLGMWWLKNICRVRKGVRPTQIMLEDCVGLKEANMTKPTHSLTAESAPWFLGEETNWFSLGVMFYATWTISGPESGNELES